MPHLLRTPHLGHLQAMLPQVLQVSNCGRPLPLPSLLGARNKGVCSAPQDRSQGEQCFSAPLEPLPWQRLPASGAQRPGSCSMEALGHVCMWLEGLPSERARPHPSPHLGSRPRCRVTEQGCSHGLHCSKEELCLGVLGARLGTTPSWYKLCLFRACINQHLMNNKDCFFCKATITGVDDFIKPVSS